MNSMRNFLILLMFVCPAFFAVAQSNRDTLVYVYTPNDTILLSQASADIIVHTSASANGIQWLTPVLHEMRFWPWKSV